MKINHILFFIIGISVLVSCTQNGVKSQTLKKSVERPIVLLVTGVGKTASMKVNTGAMNGCYNNKNGCMVFAKNETGKITFTMSGNDTGFHITEFKICEGTAPPNPLGADCPLGIDNALDFYIKDAEGGVRVPSTSSGKIEWNYTDNVKTFVLNDRNLQEQQYYYMVTACNAAQHCPTADPILDNKGVH